ncbi:uncharacterized protein LOC110053196 [Orbicella faveolata]|uniref:uncharacterized protein LOC110053196 n=1 Tax=Orbicella faveolata TaxID=48498 RepID=UPI0009E5C955|nr:uncharacterized protein LOC110053196 [Orbicella faveolata]
MVTNTQRLIFIYLSVCVLLSVGFEVKYLRYCGPPDKTFKYKITPWPELKPGKPANVTVSFTPVVDIFSSTLQFELISENDGHIIFREAPSMQCNKWPQICNLAKGETYTLKYNYDGIRAVPPGLKGTVYGKGELYNQDQVMWTCLEGEAVL